MPDIWKIAKIIPIFKKGERWDPNNYRPMSLLSCFEKIFERLLAKRIISFLKRNKILYELQFGFREGHSTVHALLELLDRIYQQLDDNDSCIGVFLDLSKAFDTIDHGILLHKLYYYGFRGKIHDWFSSYLQNRRQYTCINNKHSTLDVIKTGVPQGSVLGPILFTLYINDMQNAISLKPRLFADDTCIFNFDENIGNLFKSTNDELKKLLIWLKANKLLVNTSKTNFSIFVPTKNTNVPNAKIVMGDELKRAHEIKYLGVKIDEKLSWESHVNKVKSEIIKYSSIFAKLRYSIPKQCLLTLYDSLVTSKIGYGLEAYGVTCSKHINEIQVLQNRILKIIHFKDRKYSTNRLHKDLNITKIDDFYRLKILKFMHNVHFESNALPEVFQSYFLTNESSHKYDTRQKHCYKVIKSKKKWGDLTLKNVGARLWNRLTPSLKTIPKHKTFCNKIKETMISGYQS